VDLDQLLQGFSFGGLEYKIGIQEGIAQPPGQQYTDRTFLYPIRFSIANFGKLSQ
jgi:hypothetical protein